MRSLWRRLRHPATAWLFAVLAIGSGAVWLTGGAPAPAVDTPRVAGPTVEVPMRPVDHSAPDDARRMAVTVRWGHPAGRVASAEAMQWDGYLSLDCGDIERVEPLDLEADAAGDHIGPVVRGEAGDQRVYWRSRTLDDWDGLKVQLVSCRGEPGRETTLRIVTPQKTYAARLDWSVDDFVSMKVAGDGSSLDVHIAAQRDARALRGARITSVAPPVEAQAPVAEAPATDVQQDPPVQ